MLVSLNLYVETHTVLGHDQLVLLRDKNIECVLLYMFSASKALLVQHLCPTGLTVTGQHRSANTSKGSAIGRLSLQHSAVSSLTWHVAA